MSDFCEETEIADWEDIGLKSSGGCSMSGSMCFIGDCQLVNRSLGRRSGSY